MDRIVSKDLLDTKTKKKVVISGEQQIRTSGIK
jgi:hypothetical protein